MHSKTQLQTITACLRLLAATPFMTLKLVPPPMLLLDPRHPHLLETPAPSEVRTQFPCAELLHQMANMTIAPVPLAGISQKNRQQVGLGLARKTRTMMGPHSIPCRHLQCDRPPTVQSEHVTLSRW